MTFYQCTNTQAEDFCFSHDFKTFDLNDELDFPVSHDEILKTVKKLKANKAPGIDCLLH